MIVLMTIAHATARIRGKPGIWWIDNIAALMAVVRGRSNNSELDQRWPELCMLSCTLLNVLCSLNGSTHLTIGPMAFPEEGPMTSGTVSMGSQRLHVHLACCFCNCPT